MKTPGTTPHGLGGQVGQLLQSKGVPITKPGTAVGPNSANSVGHQVLQSAQQNGLKQGIKHTLAQELIQKATVGSGSGAVLGETTKANGGLGRKLIADAIQDLGISGNGPHPHPQPGDGPHGNGPGNANGNGPHPHHPHHGHHHPWFAIQWVPTFFAPPVHRCPEPPVVVCPPPAPLCPPPTEVIVVQTPAAEVGESASEVGTETDSPSPTADTDLASATTGETGATAPTDDAETSTAEAAEEEAVKEAQSGEVDLQVEYVQLVEDGNGEQQLGPLYRIWIVNHGTAPVVQPFDVVLVASNDESPSSDAPYAAQRVARIEAGARLSVEIRLPVEVLQMGADAEGLPVPFKNLFAAVDIQQELAELNEQNNALGLARKDVPDAAMLASSK